MGSLPAHVHEGEVMPHDYRESCPTCERFIFVPCPHGQKGLGARGCGECHGVVRAADPKRVPRSPTAEEIAKAKWDRERRGRTLTAGHDEWGPRRKS